MTVQLTGGGVNVVTTTDAAGNYAFKRVHPSSGGTFTVSFNWTALGAKVPTTPFVGADPSINSKVPENTNTILGLPLTSGTWNRYEHLGLRAAKPISVCIAVTPTSNTTCDDWRWATP